MIQSKFTDDQRKPLPKAVIYTRFSPNKNAAQSESCEHQETACFEFAEDKGYDVIDCIKDKGISGKDEFRPKLFAAISMLKRGDALITYKWDRLARDMYLMELIKRSVRKAGAQIFAATGDVEGDGPEQILVRQVVAAMAEYERKLISKRTSLAMMHKQREGRRMSRYAPYGWEVVPGVGKMVVHPEEREVICSMMEHHRAGEATHASYYSTTRYMNENWQHMARGGKWNHITVKRIIERENLVRGVPNE